jgi:hypothetical protein
MRKTLCLAAALVLAAGAARAEEKAGARAVIDKAVKAAGGADKLDKLKAETFKSKGKFYGLGEGIDYTADYAVQPPDKFRIKMEGEVGGNKFTFIQVVNGDKGWRKVNDDTMDLSKEEVAEVREELYADEVERLAPLLKGKGFELSSLGEAKVGGKPAVGVRVTHKGQRDVSLYFDKTSGLLVKSERTVKDLMAGGTEVKQETLFSGYKDVDGVQYPTKLVISRDGKKYVEAEVSDIKPGAKIGEDVFAKP